MAIGKLGYIGRLGIPGTGGGSMGLELTYGSGKKFPIWNSMAGTDKIKSFKLSGYTVQEGTPTPEDPVPLLSVGDGGLKLCISGSKTGIALQVVDFGNIVLRSLPNGVCDSIEWDGTNWKHVQRIVSIIIDENTTIQDQLAASNRIVVQVNDTLVTKSSAKNTNLCSKISNPASSVPRFHNYPAAIYIVWDSGKPATFEEAKSLIMGAEFCCELAEPVEAILEGIPALQTLDEVTYFGTPAALVKPYMMCECKVKKALKYQGNITAWWYFGGNKSNETDRQITDISGNGNGLTPYNFAWTRESGWNQGGICSDGIDDALISNEELGVENVLITTSGFRGKSIISYILGLRPNNEVAGLCVNSSGNMVSANSRFTSNPNNVPAEPLNYFLLTNNTGSRSAGLSLFNYFQTTGNGSADGVIHECLLFSSELTDEEFTDNIQLSKQRNGMDGDINIIPEPEVYYDFNLYTNENFPSEIENLASDKSKTLQLFNFAGTEESGFFEGALVSDGVDDYAIIQNQTEGFKTVFLDIINLSTNTFIYDQRIRANNSVETNTFGIFTIPNDIAYNARNSGLTYVDGVENNTVKCNDLINKRNIVTITNNIVIKDNSKPPAFFKNALENGYFAKVHIRKFLGFKEALTAEQIKLVIDKYFK